MLNDHLISVKTMSDSHLEQFIRCPYRFYQQELLNQHKHVNWRQAVQFSINNIVKEYFQTPIKNRSITQILKLIDKHWQPIRITMFETKVHYYSVLAKVSDHLIQFLTKEQNHQMPLFLYEKMNVYLDELDMNLCISFEVAEWTENSFTVKKYLLEDDVSFLQAFRNMVIMFSKTAFGKLPEKIEIYSLMNGKSIDYFPQEDDVAKALVDLKLMKNILSDRKSYSKPSQSNECITCPLNKTCHSEDQDTIKDLQTVFYM